MTSTDLATTEQPSRRSVGRQQASKPLAVTGRLKRAINLMVWENKTDNEAAVETGMTVTAIRLALNRPHVRAHVRDQREVLRTREFGRNIHTLIDVRDQKSNQMARVNAVRALELIGDDEPTAAGRNRSPGVVIQIINGDAHVGDMRGNEAKPLINNDVLIDANAERDE